MLFSHVQFLIVSQTSKLRFLNLFNCHKDAAVQRNTTKVAELWRHSADSCVITEKPASNSIYLKHNKAKTWMIVSVEMMKRQPWEKQKTETWWCTNNFKSQLKKKNVLTFWRLRIRIAKHLVLVTEHIVVDIEFVCNSTLKDSTTVHQLLLQQNALIKLQHTHYNYWQKWRTNLRCQHESLHELPHGLHVVGQLAHHLHHHTLIQGGMGINVPDLGVTVTETQSHHPLMDLLEKRSATFHVYMINGIHLKFFICYWQDILKCMFASPLCFDILPKQQLAKVQHLQLTTEDTKHLSKKPINSFLNTSLQKTLTVLFG